MKEITFFSLSYENRLGNNISPANTHPHYSLKNAGQCHSVGLKWAVLLHIVYILCTVLTGSADRKTALVYSIAEATNATSGMGRLTLHQTVSLVVILHLLAHFSIENSPVKGYICGSVDILILGAEGEGSPTCPRFAGRRRGRSLNPLRGAALELL